MWLKTVSSPWQLPKRAKPIETSNGSPEKDPLPPSPFPQAGSPSKRLWNFLFPTPPGWIIRGLDPNSRVGWINLRRDLFEFPVVANKAMHHMENPQGGFHAESLRLFQNRTQQESDHPYPQASGQIPRQNHGDTKANPISVSILRFLNVSVIHKVTDGIPFLPSWDYRLFHTPSKLSLLRLHLPIPGCERWPIPAKAVPILA